MKDTLVIYYSAENHTRKIAQRLAEKLNADLHEIAPKTPYTPEELDWNDEDSRVNQEHDDESLKEKIELTAETTNPTNWTNYSKVILCYPIWYGIAAWPTNIFVKAMDWQGKTIFPVCTSHTSGVGQSADLLQAAAKNGNWQPGKRLFQDATDEEITNLASKI